MAVRKSIFCGDGSRGGGVVDNNPEFSRLATISWWEPVVAMSWQGETARLACLKVNISVVVESLAVHEDIAL